MHQFNWSQVHIDLPLINQLFASMKQVRTKQFIDALVLRNNNSVLKQETYSFQKLYNLQTQEPEQMNNAKKVMS